MTKRVVSLIASAILRRLPAARLSPPVLAGRDYLGIELKAEYCYWPAEGFQGADMSPPCSWRNAALIIRLESIDSRRNPRSLVRMNGNA